MSILADRMVYIKEFGDENIEIYIKKICQILYILETGEEQKKKQSV